MPIRFSDHLSATPANINDLAQLLSVRISEARAEMLTYNLALMVLSPLLLLLAAAGFLFGAVSLFRDHSDLILKMTPQGFASLALVLFFVIFVLHEGWIQKQNGTRSAGPTVRALLGVGALLALELSSLSSRTPVLFWTLFSAIGFAVLAIMARASAAHHVRCPNQIVIHTHEEMAFASATVVPGILKEMLALSVKGFWLRRGLNEIELLSAAALVYAIANFDRIRQAAILRLVGQESAARILTALIHLKWVTHRRSSMVLSDDIEALLQAG